MTAFTKPAVGCWLRMYHRYQDQSATKKSEEHTSVVNCILLGRLKRISLFILPDPKEKEKLTFTLKRVKQNARGIAEGACSANMS